MSALAERTRLIGNAPGSRVSRSGNEHVLHIASLFQSHPTVGFKNVSKAATTSSGASSNKR